MGLIPPWPEGDLIPGPGEPRPRVVALRQVSDSYLIQWEGRTDEDRPIYIRFKDYHLSVRMGGIGEDIDSARMATPWLDIEDLDVIDPWTISLETVCGFTGVVVDCVVEPVA